MANRRRNHQRAQGSRVSPFRALRLGGTAVKRSIDGAIKGSVNGLLRLLLQIGRNRRWTRAGFVLPTTVMLLLVVTLTVGSISLRTFNRTNQTIGDRQQRVIYNAATPAIDRAKAKLEFLLDPSRDDRLPSGVPGERQLLAMMLNLEPPPAGAVLDPDEFVFPQKLITASDGTTSVDPYTFPDEANTATLLGLDSATLDVDGDNRPDRLDLDGDSVPDNAWVYLADTDGDTKNDSLVAYSIIFETPASADNLRDSTDEAVAERANNLQVRNGPLSIVQPQDPLCQNRADAPPIEAGWFGDFAALRKNFQVDALVLPLVTRPSTEPGSDGNPNSDLVRVDGKYRVNPTGTVAALEFQQDRQIDQGNKWGAWFRNDLEIFSAPRFNWNGAMHTEGNLIVGQPGSFTAYLISSPNSCLYERQSSEVTITSIEPNEGEGIPAFVGQIISGKIFDEDGSGRSRFHIHDDPNPVNAGDEIELVTNNDSIRAGLKPADFILDPVKLFTEDISTTRAAIDFEGDRDPNWIDRLLANEQEGRVYNQQQDTPKIDDFFRADNRYGPKPRYDGKEIPVAIGTTIADQMVGQDLSENDLTANEALDANLGLDGYWERRARREGMRLIMGQRLELGNTFGWGEDLNGDNSISGTGERNDSLYPWDRDPTTCPTTAERCHEAKQRRTLRDNLAAVQALAIYHSNLGSDDGDFPLLCMAVTTHPGTPETLEASTRFAVLPGIAPAGATLDISFLDGHGTNGWEFPAPATSATDFTTKIASTAPLGRALRNLAYFTGDPKGGAPSFPPVQEAIGGTTPPVVHPYPSLTMWGDYSMLRRILELLDTGAETYDSLSVADKTYLHTAACTLGMLAYNVKTLTDYDYATNAAQLVALNTAILGLNDNVPDNGEIDDSGTTWTIQPGDLGAVAYNVPKAGGTNPPPEAIFAALPTTQRRLAELVHLKEQVARDRAKGFAEDSTLCDPALTGELARLCSGRPKFPALYYLFPVESHEHGGTLAGGLPPVLGEDQTTLTELYVDDTYIADPTTGVNASVLYEVVGATGANDFDDVVLAPTAQTSWKLPSAAVDANSPNVITTDTGTTLAVAFMDKGVYNGREAINTRVLDLDLSLLRSNAQRVPGTGTDRDTWLPKRGIVYAFREDSIREDAVVRPVDPTVTWDLCDEDVEIQTTACLMNAIANPPIDPPLSSDKQISPKAVDYYSDPDRRPNGFRLRRGAEIGRVGDEGRGLSLISDSPVYIQGNFNLHQTQGCGGNPGCALEEFNEKLPADVVYNNNDFYNRATLNPNFARRGPDSSGLGPDLWRPTEILSDAVTILSTNFCDGSIADGILTAGQGLDVSITTTTVGYDISRYRCSNAENRTSYLNQNRPIDAAPSGAWKRANPFDQGSPFQVSRNGELLDAAANTPYAGDYYDFTKRKSLITATPTRINAVIISGLIPSRENQSYGGLHNFPRFLESWKQVKLNISGAFLQLNFSNSATGPYDQDVWEPEESPPTLTPDENIKYYDPPVRLWGYDVGLQYAPAGPISQRFTDAGSFRSEFYDEPPANDRYIENLRSALGNYLAQ